MCLALQVTGGGSTAGWAAVLWGWWVPAEARDTLLQPTLALFALPSKRKKNSSQATHQSGAALLTSIPKREIAVEGLMRLGDRAVGLKEGFIYLFIYFLSRQEIDFIFIF